MRRFILVLIWSERTTTGLIRCGWHLDSLITLHTLQSLQTLQHRFSEWSIAQTLETRYFTLAPWAILREKSTGRASEFTNNGQFEEGYWYNGKQQGKGRCIFRRGGLYEGEFKLDLKHGKGEYRFASGAKYIGHYWDGKRNGEGIWYEDDGEIKKGIWENNELILFIL